MYIIETLRIKKIATVILIEEHIVTNAIQSGVQRTFVQTFTTFLDDFSRYKLLLVSVVSIGFHSLFLSARNIISQIKIMLFPKVESGKSSRDTLYVYNKMYQRYN